MYNVEQVLKQDCLQVARKEIKAALTDLVKDNTALKKAVADLKRRVVNLERENRKLMSKSNVRGNRTGTKAAKGSDRTRITSQNVRAMRDRLGLSQAALAKYLGVSPQAVFYWEKKQGPLDFRGETKAMITKLKKMSSAEVKKQLEKIEG